ncbi:MAG: AEC family transporter [Rhodovibrionaceae bacterium]
MDAVFEIVLPLFALVAAGYGSARLKLIGDAGLKGLTRFVLYLAIPALLFRTMAGGALHRHLDLDVLVAYYLATFTLFALGYLLSRYGFRRSAREAPIFGLTTSFGNIIMMGTPVIYTAFGQEGMVSFLLIATFHSMLLLTLATLFLESAPGQGGGFADAGRKALGALLRNPVVLSILAGIAFGMTGWGLPRPVDRFAELLAGAAAPAALVALGGSLAAFRVAGELGQSLPLVAAKALLHPLLAWVLASQVFALQPLPVAVIVIAAAMPTGATVFVMAREYDTAVPAASTTVLLSTGLSVLTLAALLIHYAPLG